MIHACVAVHPRRRGCCLTWPRTRVRP